MVSHVLIINIYLFSSSCQQGSDDIGKCENKKEQQAVSQQCSVIRNPKGVFDTCIATLTNSKALADIMGIFEDCVFDACASKNPEAREESVCESVASFAEKCGDIGNSTQWRTPDFCRKYTTN